MILSDSQPSLRRDALRPPLSLPTRRRFLVVLAALLPALSLLAPLPAAAAARVFHVASGGVVPSVAPSAGVCVGGTEAAPWGRDFVRDDGLVIDPIEYAMRCVSPGDTIVIHGGTYTARVDPYIKDGNRGTASAPVTITAAAGERVLIRGAVRLDQPDFWRLRNIDITNDGGDYRSSENLLKIRGGRGWSVEGSEIWGTRGDSYAAVRVEPSDASDGPTPYPAEWVIRNNCVHDTAPVHGRTVDHNFYVVTGERAGSGLIERNLIYNATGGSNIKLGGGEGFDGPAGTAQNVVIRDNTMFNAISNTLMVGESRNNVVERNLMGGVLGKDWYPHVRGVNLSGSNNLVRGNVGYLGQPSSDFVYVGEGQGSSGTITDGGNTRIGDPRFDAIGSCGGFTPADPVAAAVGARSPGGGPLPAPAPAPAPAPVVSDPDPIERVAGASRIQTGLAISQAVNDRAGTVLIARAGTYPDALAGGPLAATLDAPILLTGESALNPEVAAEIDRLGAGTAILLGGNGALSPRVADDLAGRGLKVERLAGRDRFETAARVADRMIEAGVPPRAVYVVEGHNPDVNRGWPDAVAVSALAARQRAPILLVTTATLPAATREALDRHGFARGTVVGGDKAVGAGVAALVAQRVERQYRMAGPSRFATSRVIADESVKAGADPTHTWVATGMGFPDALAAGPAAAADDGVLLLTPGGAQSLNGEAAGWFDRYGADTVTVRVVGGTGAVTRQLADDIRRRVGG